MTQKDKELLLKDLCARLPYGCIYKASKKGTTWFKQKLRLETIDKLTNNYFDEITPYLRPMSSMTVEEKKELRNKNILIAISTSGKIETTIDGLDWLNAHHFDYRGLISMGLAIEVTEENKPYKN